MPQEDWNGEYHPSKLEEPRIDVWLKRLIWAMLLTVAVLLVWGLLGVLYLMSNGT